MGKPGSRTLGARQVRDVGSLAFGIASDVRLLEVGDRRVVLRRYLDDSPLVGVSDLVSDEFTTLRVAREVLGGLVPEPLAADPAGSGTGWPALLMSYLPGTVVVHDLDPDSLASPLAALHRSPVPPGLPRFRHWFDRARVGVPEWTRASVAWGTLAELVLGSEPGSSSVFAHRDFHPGNLLWRGRDLVGIVDWAFACYGPSAVDVAHTRANLALLDGVLAADRFLDAYRHLMPSYDHHAWWDAAELFAADDEFAGVVALNAFGAELSVELVRSRADDYAEALAESI